MSEEKTHEPEYQFLITLKNQYGLTRLGLINNQAWHDDPRRILFTLSRYKFVAKMLSGTNHALEVGCGDAFGTRVVLQEVKQITAIDIDPVFIKDINERMVDRWKFNCHVHDILKKPFAGVFDGAYSLDVLEHIPQKYEERYIVNIAHSLTEHGVLIIGTPSLQSQVYASPPSKAVHINCKDHHALKELMQKFFDNVFIFSMNDEMVHTGFYPMAHYLLAVCCSKK